MTAGGTFFAKYGGPSGGSLLSGGGIIILHVIRRHFLAAAVDPAVSLSMLGNVVISKKFLRTRKIMVMHSNERGECCPRTLVDRKRKR